MIFLTILIVMCGSSSVQAAQYKKVTKNKTKIGSYYMWIDKQSVLHISKSRTQNGKTLYTECVGAVSDGKEIYAVERSYLGGGELYRYSIQDGIGRTLAYLKGLTDIEGVYQNKLIFSGERSGNTVYEDLYTYDINTWKIKKIRSASECIGVYNQYFLFQSITGAMTEGALGVYNARTGKTKILTDKSWTVRHHGKYIYYLQDMGKSSNYVQRRVKLYRYTLTTGRKKALSKTLPVSVLDLTLTSNKFIYYDHDGRKHTLRF